MNIKVIQKLELTVIPSAASNRDTAAIRDYDLSPAEQLTVSDTSEFVSHDFDIPSDNAFKILKGELTTINFIAIKADQKVDLRIQTPTGDSTFQLKANRRSVLHIEDSSRLELKNNSGTTSRVKIIATGN